MKECHYHYLEGMMYQSLSFGHYLASSQSHISWIEDIMCGRIDMDAFVFIYPSLVNYTRLYSLLLTLTCFWSSEKTGSRTLLDITRSMGLRSQPSSCALIGSLWVEVVAGVVVVVVVVLLG